MSSAFASATLASLHGPLSQLLDLFVEGAEPAIYAARAQPDFCGLWKILISTPSARKNDSSSPGSLHNAACYKHGSCRVHLVSRQVCAALHCQAKCLCDSCCHVHPSCGRHCAGLAAHLISAASTVYEWAAPRFRLQNVSGATAGRKPVCLPSALVGKELL